MLEASVQVNLLDAKPLDKLPKQPWYAKLASTSTDNASVDDNSIEEKRGPGRPPGKKRGRKPGPLSRKKSLESEEMSSSGEVDKMRILKLPWHSGCEYQCKMCQLIYFYVEDLREHVRDNHCTPDEYLERYRIFETKAEYLKCDKCGKDVKRSFFSYRNHLREDHDMTLEDYEREFKPRVKLYRVEERLLDPN